ncbi:nuclear pore complex protein Nup58 [Atheta coriaria]|uniref:nuclear pore complex protein Nup58 n=1 Tax=Dalotia coriaria TaxID=877792 RepID=UPI0031F459B1
MSFGSGFGQTSSFGAPQQPSAFGAPAQPSTGFSFGTTAPAANTSLFGAPAQQPVAGFGAPAAAPAQQPAATGFSFNAPSAAAPTQPAFGASATPTLGTGLGTGFGANTSTTPGFGSLGGLTGTSAGAATGSTFGTSFGTSFGTPAATATSQPAAAAPSLGLSFGTPAASTALPVASSAAPSGFGLSFGTPAASTNTTGFSLGGTTSTAAPTLGLSFGLPAATSTAATGLNFGTTTTASTGLTGFSLGGFGTPASTATTALAPATAAVTPAPVGLGGVASSTPSSTATAAKTEQAPKEHLLPNEIQQTVDSFKNFVKQQKSYSSDVARCSVKEFRKVESDIDGLNNMLNEVEKQLQVNRNVAEKLKYDTAKGLQQVEMAQRTYDTPIGLQYENTAPLHFFVDLSNQFEREMQNMRLQIESTDKYIKDNGKSAPLTHQDLVLGMRRIHEIFVALAGHLQALHTQVESQKEQYLNFRKYMLNDSTNVFESTHKETENTINQIKNFTLKQPPMLSSGPTPFGNVTHPSVVQAAQQSQPPAYQTTSGFGNTLGTSGFGTGTGFGGTGTSFFGSPSFGTSGFGTSGFQLQKPPTGNKRGKQ